MSEVGEVLEKFDELESAMGTRLAKVDPLLIVDLILLFKSRRRIQYTLRGLHKAKTEYEENQS